MLTALESGPPDLHSAVPLAGDTIGMRTTSQGETVYYAVLDEPLRDRAADPDEFTPARCGEDSAGRFVWVSDVAFRPTTPGAAPHFGMRGFPVELAYVLDPDMRRSDAVDAAVLDFIAIGFIDDIDDTTAAPAVAAPAVDGDLDFDEQAEAAAPQIVAAPSPPSPRRPLIDLPPLADELEGDRELLTVPAAAPPAAGEGRRPLIDLPPLADELEDVGIGLSSVVAPPARPTPRPAPSSDKPERLRPSPDRSRQNPLPAAAPEPPRQPAPAVDMRTPASSTVAATPSAISEPTASTSVEDLATGHVSRRNPALVGLVAAAVLAAAGLIGLIAWSMNRDDSSESASATTTSAAVEPSSSAAAPTPSPTLVAPAAPPEQLLRLLPVGYPDKACTPEAAVPLGALGAVTCGLNTDPGGPRAGRYTLLADLPALQGQFNEITSTTRQQICPGNIQSPGPWRHNATPDQVAGQLYCGLRDDGTPIIAWTDDARLLLSVVDSAPGTEVAAFKWWSSHS